MRPATWPLYLSSVPECETGDIRLVGGVTNSAGRLEVCGDGMWGRVCNRLEFWGPDNARVVCRQLGFTEEGLYDATPNITRIIAFLDM